MMLRSCCLFVFIGTGVLSADPIGFTSLATASASISPDGAIVNFCDYCNAVNEVSGQYSANAAANGNFTYQFFEQGLQTGNVSGFATANVADVGFGFFDLSVSQFSSSRDFSDSIGGPVSYAMATASASFTDIITILGGTGTATLRWEVNNTATGSPGFISPVSYILPTQVTFGVPFTISASDTIKASDNTLGDGFASADFLVFGLEVNGSFMNYQYTDLSNHDYSESFGGTFVATPEPSYAGMIALLLGIAVFAKRCR